MSIGNLEVKDENITGGVETNIKIDGEPVEKGVKSINVDIEVDEVTEAYIERYVMPKEIDVEAEIVWDFDTSLLSDVQKRALSEQLDQELGIYDGGDSS